MARIGGLSRQVGALIHDLQDERLLTLAFLAGPGPDGNALISQQRAVDDDLATIRRTVEDARVLGATDKLSTRPAPCRHWIRLLHRRGVSARTSSPAGG